MASQLRVGKELQGAANWAVGGEVGQRWWCHCVVRVMTGGGILSLTIKALPVFVGWPLLKT